MGNFHTMLDALLEDQEEAVLATIVQVEGSAYRKAGASMLFKKKGRRIGLLSGGCVEEDVFQRISALGDQLTSTLIPYDMRSEDDLSWGMEPGAMALFMFMQSESLRKKGGTMRK
ncbi:xanthine dehydrogenase molybdopterin recruitment factor [Bacillus subtilis]|nr:xanthine dehydrogenase molybdopterin recruitment factor [Bacillus subtilis]